MKTTNSALIPLFLALGLAGCASVAPESQPQRVSWSQRKLELTEVRNWHIQGKIALHSPQDSGSASLDWLESKKAYKIALYGPMGANGIVIAGNARGVTLEANGKHYHAHNPEQLVLEQLGWHLPVSYLHFWIRGLPVPAVPESHTLDAYQRLENLRQAEWDLHFANYTAYENSELPTKISLHNPKLNIKIVIYRWNS